MIHFLTYSQVSCPSLTHYLILSIHFNSLSLDLILGTDLMSAFNFLNPSLSSSSRITKLTTSWTTRYSKTIFNEYYRVMKYLSDRVLKRFSVYYMSSAANLTGDCLLLHHFYTLLDTLSDLNTEYALGASAVHQNETQGDDRFCYKNGTKIPKQARYSFTSIVDHNSPYRKQSILLG